MKWRSCQQFTTAPPHKNADVFQTHKKLNLNNPNQNHLHHETPIAAMAAASATQSLQTEDEYYLTGAELVPHFPYLHFVETSNVYGFKELPFDPWIESTSQVDYG